MRTKVSFFSIAICALAPTDEKIPKNGSITLRKVWGIGGADRVAVVAPKLQLKRGGAPGSPGLGRLRTRGTRVEARIGTPRTSAGPAIRAQRCL
jgi:hypothetical protein